MIATASGDDGIRLFTEASSPGASVDAAASTETSFVCVGTVPRAHAQEVNCVSWNPVTPGLLASCSDDGEVKLWTVTSEVS